VGSHNTCVQAAFIGAAATLFGAAVFGPLSNYLIRRWTEKPPQVSHIFIAHRGQYNHPAFDKFSPDQVKQLRDLPLADIVVIPNTTSNFLVGTVITIPRTGIACFVDEDTSDGLVFSYSRRIDVPTVPPQSRRALYLWYKEPLKQDEKVIFSVPGNSPLDLVPPYSVNVSCYETYAFGFQLYRLTTLLLSAVLISQWAYRWLLRRSDSTSIAPASPNPVPISSPLRTLGLSGRDVSAPTAPVVNNHPQKKRRGKKWRKH
jgi:hypothetical protein